MKIYYLILKKPLLKFLVFLSNLFDFKIDYNKVDNSINTTNFKFLSNLENKEGFEESAFSNKRKKEN